MGFQSAFTTKHFRCVVFTVCNKQFNLVIWQIKINSSDIHELLQHNDIKSDTESDISVEDYLLNNHRKIFHCSGQQYETNWDEFETFDIK